MLVGNVVSLSATQILSCHAQPLSYHESRVTPVPGEIHSGLKVEELHRMGQLLRFGQEYRENACDFLAALLHEEGKPEEAELATCPAGSGAS